MPNHTPHPRAAEASRILRQRANGLSDEDRKRLFNRGMQIIYGAPSKTGRLLSALRPFSFWKLLIAVIALGWLAVYAADHRYTYRPMYGLNARVDNWTGSIEYFNGRDWTKLP